MHLHVKNGNPRVEKEVAGGITGPICPVFCPYLLRQDTRHTLPKCIIDRLQIVYFFGCFKCSKDRPVSKLE